MNRSELLSTLEAFAQVVQASWPTLNPGLAARRERWGGLDAAGLKAELDRCLSETEVQGQVRVFWKLLPDFNYGGVNDHFARDAGFRRGAELVGKSDFSPGMVWINQAAKFRKDDQAVIANGKALLDIIERLNTPGGITWLRTSKAPIRLPGGVTLGIMGMYEPIDRDTANRLLREQELKRG